MAERKNFIDVDALMPRVTLPQIAQYYGIPLPELHRIGAETRTKCFLNCGRGEETGPRVLAIQEGDPVGKWHCHQYGCGKGGNKISLCDLMKPGQAMNGRPKGERFKAIASDLQTMANGTVANAPIAAPLAKTTAPVESAVNIPLKDSDNERARSLVDLDQKFVVDAAEMNPKASAYLRRRPFLTPDVCRNWRVGYLPRDVGGEDKSGGTMRGKIVYAYLNEQGEVLTWFGRDPEFEDKHQKWNATGKVDKEPQKFHFVKGFHRGQELFGQHQLANPEFTARVYALGTLLVVEGPNDVIRLDTLGVPAVGLCSNMITREQSDRLAEIAAKLCGGKVTVFLDCDAEGEAGMRQALGYLSQRTFVRLAWTSKMFGGKFTGRQPESITIQEWAEVAMALAV